jgi:hypothetical protein
MPLRYLPDLAGTLQSIFRIGTNKLSSSAGLLTVRNQANNADAAIAASATQLNGATSGSVTLQPAGTVTTYTLTLPGAQGASGYGLINDGSGNMSWQPIETARNSVKAEKTTIAYTDATKTVVNLGDGNTVQRVIVEVETAFTTTGVAPTLTVGYTGAESRYIGTTTVDLTTVAVYEVAPMDELTANKQIVVYYTANDADAGAAVVTVEWSLPDTVAPA